MRYFALIHVSITLLFSTLAQNPPSINWTQEYDPNLAEFALEFAAAAYAINPIPCLKRHDADLIKRVQIPCDYVRDECWALIALSDEWIIFAVRGTKTKLQLISELVESMTAPKKKFPSGGAVQRYFYVALKAIWNEGFGDTLRKLKLENPRNRILFTGHSLGGALASLASSLFTFENQDLLSPDEVFLVTFGQPRVGNQEYAQAHDLLIPNSWRVVHRYDIVAHLPYCYETIFSHQCASAFNHGPFHHGTEIWYPDTMNSNVSMYRICNDAPVNEDQTCSNSEYIHYDILDHARYFNKHVSKYGNLGCNPHRYERYLKVRKRLRHSRRRKLIDL